MTRLIGARWKCGNTWSRSVLIGPSPFYVLCFIYNYVVGRTQGDTASNRSWILSNCGDVIKINRYTLWTSIVIIRRLLLLQFGAHSAGVIPVPIPNTEVKPSCADYTALRETRKVPNCGLDFLERKSSKELHFEKLPRSEFPEVFCFWITVAR